jgi:hypothetical protein
MDTVRKKIHVMLLCALCTFFSFHSGTALPFDFDMHPQLEKIHTYEFIEYENILHQQKTRSNEYINEKKNITK